MQSPPRIVHQTWKSNRVPEWARDYHASWRRWHPSPPWEHRLWTDDECRAFVAEHEPAALAMYDAFPKHIMRVDFVRYAWLYHLGGLYVDLDFECFASFELLRTQCRLMIGRSVHGVLSNSIMMSVPGHPFWRRVMDEIAVRAAKLTGVRWSPSLDVLNTTGPNVVHAVAKRDGYLDERTRPADVLIPLSRLFFPYSCFEFWKKNRATFSGAMACHRHQTTWAPHVKYARIVGAYALFALFVAIVVGVFAKRRQYLS